MLALLLSLGWVVTTSTFSIYLDRFGHTTDQSYRSEEIEISPAHTHKHTHKKCATSDKNSNSANKAEPKEKEQRGMKTPE